MVLFLSFFLYSVFFKYTWRFTTALMSSKIYITRLPFTYAIFFYLYTKNTHDNMSILVFSNRIIYFFIPSPSLYRMYTNILSRVVLTDGYIVDFVLLVIRPFLSRLRVNLLSLFVAIIWLLRWYRRPWENCAGICLLLIA